MSHLNICIVLAVEHDFRDFIYSQPLLIYFSKILQVSDLGATCALLEYNSIEGFIASSDYSRKRIRSVKKLIRVGKQEVLQVLRVDEEKGYVDLSKKLLTPEDIVVCSERFEKSKTVNGILRRLAEVQSIKLIDLYEKFGWDMYETEEDAAVHAYDVLQEALIDPKVLDNFDIPKEMYEEMLTIVKHRMMRNPVKVEAEINLTCFGEAGVNAIREALLVARDCGTKEAPITVVVRASPVYTLSTVHLDKAFAADLLNKAIEAVKAKITTYEYGALEVKSAPKQVT